MMYESRLHASNGRVSIALDAHNGELLELNDERTGDNLIKSNCAPRAWSPFVLETPEDGVRLHAPRYEDIRLDPSLAPEVSVEQGEGEATARILYPRVVGDTGALDVRVEVIIILPRGEERTRWFLKVENHTDRELQRALFPCLNGLWLGDRWEDDELVYPYNAGLRVPNPTRALSQPPAVINWRWQEYNYAYALNGPCGTKNADGAFVWEHLYSGPCSMLWMDLYDRAEDAGLYMTCRNAGLRLKALRAESFGPERPGLGLAIVHLPCLPGGRSWESEECVVALHRGDWHWAADDYGAWRRSVTPFEMGSGHRPAWFETSPGLVAHYDFQYQNGGVVHRFCDIPALLEQARALGMNHLLLSGWHVDGFDNGYPQYRPNPALGTEAELLDALRTVRERGGHVAFYVNTRLCNTKYPEHRALYEQGAIMRRDGRLAIERYGAASIEFACMCNQTRAWQEQLAGAALRLTETIGADSLYLDQLMATAQLCYHPGHAEHAGDPSGWNQGYARLLDALRARDPEDGVALLCEFAGDVHGWRVSGQLVSSMFNLDMGSAPEVYKYTFPEQILMDMMNPRRNSGMRPAHLARRSTLLLYRAFAQGAYLWVYDLEQDNTFRRDPEQCERLRRVCALRRAWLEGYGQGTFRDTVGLGACAEGLLAKRYELPGGVLVACAAERPAAGLYAEVLWANKTAPSVSLRTGSAPSAEQRVDCPCVNGVVRLPFPEEEELAVWVLRADPERP